MTKKVADLLVDVEVGGQYCENCHVGKIVPGDAAITAVSEGVRS